MSSSPTDEASADRAALIEAENYRETVHAILGFGALIVHDGKGLREGSAFGFGRRMTRAGESADNNSDHRTRDITPDLVAQRSKSWGAAVEAKATLCKDRLRWDRHIAQVAGYGAPLIGWWTNDETIPAHDAILLVNISYSVAMKERLEAALATNPDAVGDNVSIVEFTRHDQMVTKLYYRQQWGRVSDPSLRDVLHEGRDVPLLEILRSFGPVMFYDSPAPLPHMLELLWGIFSQLSRAKRSTSTNRMRSPSLSRLPKLLRSCRRRTAASDSHRTAGASSSRRNRKSEWPWANSFALGWLPKATRLARTQFRTGNRTGISSRTL